MIPVWALWAAIALLLVIVRMQHRYVAAYSRVADELEDIKRQRSEATRKGNLTKAANRRAKQDQTTEKLRAEVTA